MDLVNSTLAVDTRLKPPGVVELLQTNTWDLGGANFWLLVMFGPLTICFVVAYIVHLFHVSISFVISVRRNLVC